MSFPDEKPTVRVVAIRIRVDYENNAEAWWNAAAVAAKEPTVAGEVFRALLRSEDIRVTRQEFAAWLNVAERLPSWNDGPRFASCPVTMSEETL